MRTWLITVERRLFVELLKTPETQARIIAHAETGKLPATDMAQGTKTDDKSQTRTPTSSPRHARRSAGERHSPYQPDDLLAHVLASVVARLESIRPHRRCRHRRAMPERAWGMNVARIGPVAGRSAETVPGMTINRFCASGLQAVADAAAIRSASARRRMIAAGTESMSSMPADAGNKMSMNLAIFEQATRTSPSPTVGLTAEKVAERWRVTRARLGCLRPRIAPAQKARRNRRRSPRPSRRPTRSAKTCPTLKTARSPARAHGRYRRRSARRHHAAKSWANRRVFHARFGDGRQLVADVRRRRRRDAGLEKVLKELNLTRWPASCRLRGRSGVGRRSWASARSRRFPRCWTGRHQAGRSRLDRAQRSLRRAVAGGDERTGHQS